jgi:rhamnose utilization protein RhaD (predicted bifunctional aldolase and dehydrogenase)
MSQTLLLPATLEEEIRECHELALKLVEDAERLLAKRCSNLAQDSFQRAYALEQRAAHLRLRVVTPTSAQEVATFQLNAAGWAHRGGQHTVARQLADFALQLEPPTEIAQQLEAFLQHLTTCQGNDCP